MNYFEDFQDFKAAYPPATQEFAVNFKATYRLETGIELAVYLAPGRARKLVLERWSGGVGERLLKWIEDNGPKESPNDLAKARLEHARMKGFALGDQIAWNAIVHDLWCARRANLEVYFSGGDPGRGRFLGDDVDIAAEIDVFLSSQPDVATLKDELAAELATYLPRLLYQKAASCMPEAEDIAREMANRYVNRFVRETVGYVDQELSEEPIEFDQEESTS